jgi:predicted anti-sigma-YlaC factor YlaD
MSAEHTHDSTCRRYLDTLSDYFDGELSEELCKEIETHMQTCENCRIVVNTLSKTLMLYRRLPSPELPNDVKERLYKVLDIRPYYKAPED